MKWQKRECPINMELVPYGSGWEDVTLDICGNHHWWSVSGCLGEGATSSFDEELELLMFDM